MNGVQLAGKLDGVDGWKMLNRGSYEECLRLKQQFFAHFIRRRVYIVLIFIHTVGIIPYNGG